MLLPSKKLLSEVLELDGIDRIDFERNSIFINYFYEINIHQLAHKCKEWALSKGYIIEVGVHLTIKKDRSDRDYFYKITTDRGQRLISKFVEIIKTEPEAIFKACEYIMEQEK